MEGSPSLRLEEHYLPFPATTALAVHCPVPREGHPEGMAVAGADMGRESFHGVIISGLISVFMLATCTHVGV